MTTRLMPGFGDPTYEVTAPEAITLPSGFAPGRQITYRRTDSGTGAVTVQAVNGDVLNGAPYGTVALGAGATAVFRSTDPGRWRYTVSGGSSPSVPSGPNALELVPYTATGHSYNIASGAGSSDTSTQFNQRFASRMRTQPLLNLGVGGNRIDQTVGVIAGGWTPGKRGFVSFICLVNDVEQFADANGIPTSREAFRSCLAQLSAFSIVPLTSAAFAFRPEWTNGSTSTVGSYVDIAFNGDTVYLQVTYGASGGTASVTRPDGTTGPAISTSGYLQTFTGAVKLSGYGPGTHQIRLAVTSGTIAIAGMIIPADTPPVIMWLQEGALGAFSDALNALITSTYPAGMRPVLADFPNVVECPLPGARWNPALMLGSDLKHPNDAGHDYLATRMQEVVASSLTTYQQGLNRLTATTTGSYTVPTANFVLATATIPGAPTGLTAVSDSQVFLSLTAPSDGGATITGYVVQSSPAGANTWTTAYTSNRPFTDILVPTGLTSGTSYDFRVAATNGKGTGPYSGTATATAGTAGTYAADTFTGGSAGSPVTPTMTTSGRRTWVSIADPASSPTWLMNGTVLTGAGAGTGNCVLLEDDQAADGTISVTYRSGTFGALNFRMADRINGYNLALSGSTYTMQRIINGTYNTVAPSTTPPTVAANAVLSIVLNGSSVTGKVNGTTYWSFTDANFVTNTRHGVSSKPATPVTYNAFSHTTATT